MQLTNGLHKHTCPRCKTRWDCPKVTHCRDAEEAVCWECREQLSGERGDYK